MSEQGKTLTPVLARHGMWSLPHVMVEDYNLELRDGDDFVGDRASKGAFRLIIDSLREPLRKAGGDPLGDKPSSDLSKKKLDKILVAGHPEAAAVIQAAIQQFASEFAAVIERFLKVKAWRNTQKIVVGGGLRASRIGELVIERTAKALKDAGHGIDLQPIHHDPDEAGLMGAVHLVPSWIFEGYDAILAADIGGSNIRAGLLTLNSKKRTSLPVSTVHELELWCYADEDNQPSRSEMVDRLHQMLRRLTKKAEKAGLRPAPFVGLACPGVIAADGSIERGGQNLPGNWQSNRFNLPAQIQELLPQIGRHPTTVVMHNDAVVQGLSEIPFVRDVPRWAVFTIGTGLGNAVFTNHETHER